MMEPAQGITARLVWRPRRFGLPLLKDASTSGTKAEVCDTPA